MARSPLVLLTLAAGLVLAGCPKGGPPAWDPSSDPYLADAECGDLGYLPPDPSLSEAENKGRCAWYLYTGGGEEMFRLFAIATKGRMDLLKVLDTRQRGERFATFGAINDPGCKQATEPDEYGLWMDDCQDPYAAGAMGFRKRPNPKYKPELWDAEKYVGNPLIEPPYRIGLTCGICHLGFSPTNPPADPANPSWENIDTVAGNQYLDEAFLYRLAVDEEHTEWQVLKSHSRGVVDPTRIANDNVENPTAVRAVINFKQRQTFPEEMNDGSIQDVHRVFNDGSDYGVETAAIRVWLNLGLCFKFWAPHHMPLIAATPQRVFDMEKAAEVCEEFNVAREHARNLVKFVESQSPTYRLADAPGGEAYLTDDPEILNRGKLAFAEKCATCHSSKQPPPEIAEDEEKTIEWFREAVMQDDFLEGNLLGDERRYNAIETGGNLQRAMNSNSGWGRIYEQFSSATYKNQPSGGSTELYNPFDPDNPIPFEFPPGLGYYKTFPIFGVWAFAPFLHNNSLGEYTGDPSVAGRVKAFEDAAEKLLWPEKRPGIEAITHTAVDSKPYIPTRSWLEVPAGTPTVLLANIDWVKLTLDKDTILARLKNESFEEIVPLLLEHNLIPDFIPDRGHTYGEDLSDEDKRALIEYMKWM
ncbi:MAG: hypothetical protein GY719_30475 [bacterium]|nr:hypothetical protein [bacterium]